MPKARLYLVRHGKRCNTIDVLKDGEYDTPLTAEGELGTMNWELA